MVEACRKRMQKNNPFAALKRNPSFQRGMDKPSETWRRTIKLAEMGETWNELR